MPEFGFTEEHTFLRQTVQKFVKGELVDGAKERAILNYIPDWVIKKVAEQGYIGMAAPEQYGGQAMDWRSVGIVVEELGKVDLGAAHLVIVPAQLCALLESGTEEQRQKWIPPLLCGDVIPSVCITESVAGTDVAGIQMKAIKEGDHYLLDGEKAPITRGMQANLFVVWAKTDPTAGARGVSCFLIPKDASGLSVTEIDHLGFHPLRAVTVTLDGVNVPVSDRVGDEGKGFAMLMDRFDIMKVLISLIAVGLAETSLKEVMDYVKLRTVFGSVLAKNEAISFKIAEAFTLIDACRLLCYRALWLRDHGMRHSKESAMVKSFVPKTAFKIAHDCILMMGHYGYSREHAVGQRMLDVLGYQIADGTVEAQNLILVREILGKEFLPYR
jgi:cyclohexanecarboxyl-CoA dehydrogenase